MAHVRAVPRADGHDSYEVRWRQHGKFRQRTFHKRREAERFALQVESELEDGQNTAVHQRRGTTVAQARAALVEEDKLKLKPRTLVSYQQAYDNHIHAVFGARRLSTVTRDEVQAWVTSLSVDKQLAPATVHSTFVALRKVFRHALAGNHLRHDPCQKIALPAGRHEEEPVGRALSADEVDRLATALDAYTPYGLIVRFLAGTGLRRSELAGLRVRDVNLLRGHVEVRQTVQQIKDRGWHTDSPKSKTSRRDVPLLDPDLRNDLAAYLAQHPRRHEPDAGLWPGRRAGGYTHGRQHDGSHELGALDYTRQFDPASFYRYYFKPAAARAGLGPVRLHDLRHTFGSMLAASGTDVYKVSRWLGHYDVAITSRIYLHLYPNDHEAEALRLAALKNRQRAQAARKLRAVEA